MIDWEAVRAEVTGHLQALIRIDTTNPPGNESKAARYLEGILRQEGFDPLFVESAPDRGNVLVAAVRRRRATAHAIGTYRRGGRRAGVLDPPALLGCSSRRLRMGARRVGYEEHGRDESDGVAAVATGRRPTQPRHHLCRHCRRGSRQRQPRTGVDHRQSTRAVGTRP